MSVYPVASPEYFSYGAAEDLGVTHQKPKARTEFEDSCDADSCWRVEKEQSPSSTPGTSAGSPQHHNNDIDVSPSMVAAKLTPLAHCVL